MNSKRIYRSLAATCLSTGLMLCSSPGWARNPYQDGHVAPGASKQAIDKAKREAARRDAEARARERKEARNRGHQQDRAVNSDGKFVRHPDVPVAGVDQKGGMYDKVRRENPDVQRAVLTRRRGQNQGGSTPTIQPINKPQQPTNGQPNRTPPAQPPLERGSLLKQADLVEQRRHAFEEKYRENCARTGKPNCDPPNGPSSTGGGTSSYEETGLRAK